MVDAHRHLPATGEPLPDEHLAIWFATSLLDEWESIERMPRAKNRKIGFGLLPASLPHHRVDDLLAHLQQHLDADEGSYLGEFGLDERCHQEVSEDHQMSFAIEMLRLAQSNRRIAVLHHVGPLPTLYRLLRSVDISSPVIIHGFLGSVETARRLADLGCTVSLGPRVWTGRTKLAARLRELDIPYLLESDFPHIPHTWQAGYQELLERHYTEIARLADKPVERLKEETDEFATVLAHRATARG